MHLTFAPVPALKEHAYRGNQDICDTIKPTQESSRAFADVNNFRSVARNLRSPSRSIRRGTLPC